MRTGASVLRRFFFVFATFVIANNAQGQGTGFWHTSGNQILDANSQTVRIAGINWYGFETSSAVAGGLSTQDYKIILETIKNEGYNTIRLPFSNQMVETPTPGSRLNISYWHGFGPINLDLQGLDSMQVMDKIITYAGTLGLKVILDNHRSEAGNSAQASGLWYTGAYPESAWIADWTSLAARYSSNSTVIGFDLRNEPHNATSGGSCWDCGSLSNDWHLAAQRAGNAVLAVNPQLLIFVEGTDAYNNDFYWWGGNLEGVANSPVVLALPNHLVYSAHDYGPNEYRQQWFNGNTTPASLAAVWSRHWAYISQAGIAPVWLGEFGSENADYDIVDSAAGSQGQWFSSLVSFLKTSPNLSWTYWALNGEDSYGLLDKYYNTAPPNALKQTTLASIQFALNSGVAPAPSAPAAPAGLTATAVSSGQINLTWTPSVTSGVNYTILFGTTPAGLSTVLSRGIAGNSYQATGLNPSQTYYFEVEATSVAGTSAPSNVASASTLTAPVPAAPSALSATAVSSSTINLSWTASLTPGVAYSIYSSTSAGVAPGLLATGVMGNFYQASGLSSNTAYYFTVAAVSGSSSSAVSNQASATTSAPQASAPSAPSGLSASSASQSQINLQWQGSSSSGVTYNVYFGSVNGSAASLLASGISGTSYAANGLLDGSTYFFVVRSVAAGGTSAASNQASATTQTAPAAAPTGVTATPGSSTQVSLSWNPVANTGATYNVYVGTSSGATNTQLAGGLNGSSYQATNLQAATTYFFTVRSVSGGGTSSPSNQASATTLPASVPTPAPTPAPAPASPVAPAAPTSLAAAAANSTQINLAWGASSTSGVTYTVYAGTSAAALGPLASGVAGTSYSATALTPGTTYYFAVTASNSSGSSPSSNQASATTQPGAAPTAPSGLSASATSASNISLAWVASPSTAVTYSIFSGTSAGAETTLLASGVVGTNYAVSGLNASSTYFFIVKAVSGTANSVASNSASATTQASAAGTCHVAYTDQVDWGVGFTGGIAITNTGTTPMTSWTLTYSYSGNQQIYQSWSSNYTQSGKSVTLSNAAWNGAIAPNATVMGVGFNANYSGSNNAPSVFTLNGVLCK